MGKNKQQAQRTKNNARPSNSSRSAQLLGTSVPNFVGFSAVRDGGYVPILPGLSLCDQSEVEMSNVDPNFQIVLKKMNKKDATTKYKALQEFAKMCQETELSIVESMLSFWPRLYTNLATDVEHRVRESAQIAHTAVVKRVGKSIAVYLKQLAGPWFTSQYDPYPPAASTATNSFNATFPGNKVIDAIIHCQREILSYICDIITIQTPQSFSIQKSLTTEEMDARYEKVLVACLQSYIFYFNKIGIQEIEKVIDIHYNIISNSKFWKLGKHNSLPVKTAFFNVLTAIMQNATKILKDEKKKTLTTIMNSLDESEPGILSAVWESMLIAINKIEDWHQYVNVEKLVLPKLWRVLKNGGQSCASIIYPNLLPFVSQFSKLNIDTSSLYSNFFNNMRQGFNVKSVLMSRAETFAVTTSFFECLRYVILLNCTDLNLCKKLLLEELIPLIEMCLTQKNPAQQTIFCEVSQLVRYWSKNRNEVEFRCYSELIQQFWSQLLLIFNKIMVVDQSGDNESFFSNPQNAEIELLFTLKNASRHSRKNLRVKFSESTEENSMVKSIEKCPITPEFESDIVFYAELMNFVNKICIVYFNRIRASYSNAYVNHFCKLVTAFESKELFLVLSKTLREDATIFDLYCEIIENLLLEKSESRENFVQLVFNMIKYLNNTEKDKVLASLLTVHDIEIIRSVIRFCLSKDIRNDEIVQKWYRQAEITKHLVDVAKDIVTVNYVNHDQNEKLLMLAFETTNEGHLLIHEEGINEISTVVSRSIFEQNEDISNNLSELVSSLIKLTWTHEKLSHGALELIEGLFELSTRECNTDIYQNSLKNVLKSGLAKCLDKLSHEEFIELTKKLASIVWKKVRHSQLKSILETVIVDFIETVISHNEEINTDNNNIREIVLTFLIELDVVTWLTESASSILYAEVLNGNLYISSYNQKFRIGQHVCLVDISDKSVADNLENCLRWALLTSHVLQNVYYSNRHTSENENEGDGEDRNQNIVTVTFPGLTNLVLHIMYIISLSNTYCLHYKSTKNYNTVNSFIKPLKIYFKEFYESLSVEINESILEVMKIYDENIGILPHVARYYFTELSQNKNAVDYLKLFAKDLTSEVYLQTLQLLSECLDIRDIPSPVDDDLYELIFARSMLQTGKDECMTLNIFKKIQIDYSNSASLLFDRDISNASWEQISFNLEIIRILTASVEKMPKKLPPPHWDCILISLASLQLSINKSLRNHNDFKITAFVVAVNQLYRSVLNLLNKHAKESIEELPPLLIDEWTNVFADDVHAVFVKTWMLYSETYEQKSSNIQLSVVFDTLGKSLQVLDGKILFKNSNKSSVNVQPEKIIDLSLQLLKSSRPSNQLAAYDVLKYLVKEFAERDRVLIEKEDFDVTKLNIRKFEETLISMQTVVNTMLMEFKLCDTVSCTIQPFTDAYTYCLGYLFTWAIILDMCAKANGDLRYHYAEWLKDDYFTHLLNNIFRLMPVEVLQDNKNKIPKLVEIFTTVPSFDFEDSWTEWRLEHLVCWLYTNSLRVLPVLVRQWWSTSDNRVSAAVDKITTLYVSSMLCQEELLNNKLENVENMQVKIHPTAREVVALYQMDDTKLELSIVLPPNHPLGPVTVEPGQHAGGAANWRNCHMQLSIFLTHQNGSVWDGLMMWKKNLDKKFAGVEECYICFSIFHSSTYQIPKLSCHTCRKKFHTPCLYKWFNTSQKSSCPICRNMF